MTKAKGFVPLKAQARSRLSMQQEIELVIGPPEAYSDCTPTPDPRATGAFRSDKHRQAAWDQHRERLLKRYVEDRSHPVIPWAYFTYDRPGTREERQAAFERYRQKWSGKTSAGRYELAKEELGK